MKQNENSLFARFTSNGYALFIFATCMFACMGLFVKLSSNAGIPPFEVIFFRSFINLILMVAYAWIQKKPIKVYDKPLMLLRSVIGFIAFSCYFLAITKIKLADAVILSYTAPVFTAILSALILKEKFSVPLFLSVFVSLSGAMLVVKPSGDFFNSGGFFGLMAGILAAGAFITIRKLGQKHSATTIIIWFTLISSIMALPLALRDFIIPDLKGMLYIFLVGAFSSAGQLGMTRGYKFLPAQKGSMTMLLNIVLSAILSYFILKESMDIYTVLGGLLVLVSSVGVLIYKPIFFHKHPNRTF